MPASNTIPSTQSLIAGALRVWLGLLPAQCVVYNQNWRLPTDKGLYVTISSLGPNKPYGTSTSTLVNEKGELVESVSVNSREVITIDLRSRDQSALDRKEEALAWFASSDAQMFCEQWAIKLAQIPLTFVDASRVEGAARVNRQHLAMPLLRTRSTSRVVPSFDTDSLTNALTVEA